MESGLSFTIWILLVKVAVVMASYSVYPSCPGVTIPAVIRAVGVPIPEGDITPANGSSPASGYFVALLDAVQAHTGIPYKLTLQPAYKLYNGFAFNGTVIEALVNNEADLSITLSSITLAATEVVDYLQTVMENSILVQILYNLKFGLTNKTQYIITPQFGDLAFLKGSTIANHQAIYNNIIAAAPDSFVEDDVTATAKVLSGNFAYITDQPFRDRIRDKHPDLLGGNDDVIGVRYCALAVQIGSPLRRILNQALQRFVEDGTLATLAVQYPNRAC